MWTIRRGSLFAEMSQDGEVCWVAGPPQKFITDRNVAVEAMKWIAARYPDAVMMQVEMVEVEP